MGTSSVTRGVPVSARRISSPDDGAMLGASPGWYYDPADEAIYRWFDGESWTAHLSDIFSPDSPVEGGIDRTN